MSTTMDKKQRAGLVLLIAMIPNIVVLMNTGMVNNAAPTIMKELGTTIGSFQWVENAFLLTITVLLVASGRLADIYGRKKLFVLGNLLLVIGSVLSVAGLSVGWLIFTQFIAGVGATLALATALPLLIIGTPPGKVGKAIGWWTAGATIGAAFGPFCAGIMAKAFGWQTIFLLPAALSLVALVGAIVIMKESRNEAEEKKMDYPGAVLLCLGLVFVVFAITRIGQVSMARVITVLGLGLLLLAIFVFVQTRAKHPLIHISLLKNRVMATMNLAVATCYFAMMGGLFLISYFMQSVLLYEPTKAGLTAIPFAISGVFVAPFAASFAGKYGARIVVSAGLLLFVIFYGIASEVNEDSTFAWLMFVSLLTGFGIGVVSAASTVGAMQPIPPEESGVASGYFSTWRQMGKSLGVAVVGGMLFTQFATRDLLAYFSVNPNLSPGDQQSMQEIVLGSGHGATGSSTLSPALVEEAHQVIGHSYQDSILVICAVCLIVALIVFFFGKEVKPDEAFDDPELDVEIAHEHELEVAPASAAAASTGQTDDNPTKPVS